MDVFLKCKQPEKRRIASSPFCVILRVTALCALFDWEKHSYYKECRRHAPTKLTSSFARTGAIINLFFVKMNFKIA